MEYPIGGLSDNVAFGKQPPGTSPVLLNERSIDPRTGRIRGAQRAGLSKYNSNLLSGANPIKHIRSFVRNNRLITYKDKTSGGSSGSDTSSTYDEVFATTTEKGKECRNLVTDRQSNVYATDGNGSIQKFSADGESIWRLEVPVSDRHDIIRALDVDDLFNVYVGISDGTDSEKGKIFKYRQEPIEEDETCKETQEPTIKEWEIETGRWVERVKVRRGFLYTLQNDPETNRAFITIYDLINTTQPELVSEREVPHPAHDFDVGLDGSIYVASDENSTRGINPRVRGYLGRAIDWTPQNLTDSAKRIWTWLRAEDLQFDLQDGDGVTFWEDFSGNGHHLKADLVDAPTFQSIGIGGLPSVHFNRAAQQFMESDGNEEVDLKFVDQMRTVIPGAETSSWALFMVIRAPREAVKTCVIQQRDAELQGDPSPLFQTYQGIHANTGTDATPASPAAANAGDIFGSGFSLNGAGNDAAHGNFPNDFQFARSADSTGHATTGDPDPGTYTAPGVFEPLDTDTRTAIVTLTHNGNSSGDVTSVWRCNGVPIDIWAAESWQTLDPTTVGKNSMDVYAVSDYFQGDIAEILVIADNEASTTSGTGHAVTHPSNGTSGLYYPDDVWDSTQDATEIEQIEGYLAWKYGIHNELTAPNSSPPAGTFPHPFHTDLGPPPVPGSPSETLLLDTTPILSKYDANSLDLQWALSSREDPGFTNKARGGIGYAVAADCIGNVWSFGPHGDPLNTPDDTEDITWRYIVDDGDNFITDDTGLSSQTEEGAFSIRQGISQTYKYPVMVVDKHNNLYCPTDDTDPDTPGDLPVNYTFVILANDQGVAALHNLRITVNSSPGTTLEYKLGRACAIDPNIPDYQGDLVTTQAANKARAEFCYIGTDNQQFLRFSGLTYTNGAGTYNGTDAFDTWRFHENAVVIQRSTPGPGSSGDDFAVASKSADGDTITLTTTGGTSGGSAIIDLELAPGTVETVHKARLVDADDNTSGSLREQVNLAAVNGNLVQFDDTAVPTTVGTGVFNTSAKIIQSAEVRGEVFFTDGLGRYRVFRRVEDSSNDEVAVVDAKEGKIPPRCKLMTTYRGRLVIAADPNEPHNWYMSASNDAYNWDFFPTVPTSTQAIAGNAPVRAGLSPDIVTALIPAKDDTLIIGGDRSINMLSGDPAQGGQIDLISETRGIAFGSPWAKDPEERIYFFGSKGGVYVTVPSPGATPQRLSVDWIERRLQDVDLSTHRIEMEWDWRGEGLFIAQVPYGAGGSIVQHWFWEQKTGSWHEDEYGNSDFTGCQPTTIAVLDGDTLQDRVLVFGCEDGYVRKVDENARDDDEDGSGDPVPIYSRARIGPIMSPKGNQARYTAVWPKLASDQNGCEFKVFFSDTADVPGDPKRIGQLRPGNNGRVPARGRGTALWFELSNGSVGESWAYEGGFIEAIEAGRSRSRS